MKLSGYETFNFEILVRKDELSILDNQARLIGYTNLHNWLDGYIGNWSMVFYDRVDEEAKDD